MTVALADSDVAAHAIALRGGHVLLVIEHQVRARIGELVERTGCDVTPEARVRIVRLRVTLETTLSAGHVQSLAIVDADADVTLRTRHAREHVLAMRKRLRRAARESEDPRARGEENRDHDRDPLHRTPHVRPSCTSASRRRRSVGDADASIAIAAFHGPLVQPSATSAHGHTRPSPRSWSGSTSSTSLLAVSAYGSAIRAVPRAPVQPASPTPSRRSSAP